MRFHVRPTTESDARIILAWRYDPPYDLYNAADAESDDDVRSLADPAQQYFSVLDDDDTLIAYICFGEEAQVPGGEYGGDALDIGCGMRPDLTGRGTGPAIIELAMSFGDQTYGPPAFRATIAAFNGRASKAAERAGFMPTGTFRRPTDDREFVILERRGPAHTIP